MLRAKLAQDFAANYHCDHRSSPEGWAPRGNKAHAYLELGELVEAGGRSCSLGTSLSLLTGRRWPLQKAFAPCNTLHILNGN